MFDIYTFLFASSSPSLHMLQEKWIWQNVKTFLETSYFITNVWKGSVSYCITFPGILFHPTVKNISLKTQNVQGLFKLVQQITNMTWKWRFKVFSLLILEPSSSFRKSRWHPKWELNTSIWFGQSIAVICIQCAFLFANIWWNYIIYKYTGNCILALSKITRMLPKWLPNGCQM